jgi:hypothetical protein
MHARADVLDLTSAYGGLCKQTWWAIHKISHTYVQLDMHGGGGAQRLVAAAISARPLHWASQHSNEELFPPKCERRTLPLLSCSRFELWCPALASCWPLIKFTSTSLGQAKCVIWAMCLLSFIVARFCCHSADA